MNRRLLARSLLPLVRSLSAPCFAVTTIPIVVDLIDLLPVQRWIYYCVDEYGKWPGLANEQLNQGRDLALTTDYRAVLGEVVAHTLGADNLEMIFPGASLARDRFLRLV